MAFFFFFFTSVGFVSRYCWRPDEEETSIVDAQAFSFFRDWSAIAFLFFPTTKITATASSAGVALDSITFYSLCSVVVDKGYFKQREKLPWLRYSHS